MEMKENFAKFRISDRELEISGPVDFVAGQLQDNKTILNFFADALKKNLLLQSTSAAQEVSSFKALPPIEEVSKKGSSEYVDFEVVNDQNAIANKYSNVVAIDENKIQVLGKIPGNTLGSRMINLILIYLYLKLKTAKIERISFNDLRSFCELHGELDAAHFADYMKKSKKYFLIDGSGRNAYAKITVPGMREAEQILSTIK